MKHIIARCKHCGVEYIYSASGEGCHDELNDREYCHECKKAMIEALKRIPVKFIKAFKTVNQDDLDAQTLEYINEMVRFHKIKRQQKPTHFFSHICRLGGFSEHYRHSEIICYGGKEYLLNTPWDITKPCEFSIAYEKNVTNGKLTNKTWTPTCGENYQYLVNSKPCTIDISVPMNKPLAKLFFMTPKK